MQVTGMEESVVNGPADQWRGNLRTRKLRTSYADQWVKCGRKICGPDGRWWKKRIVLFVVLY